MNLSWDKNLRHRLMVGLTGGPLILLSAFVGSWYFFALIAIIVMFSLQEFQLIGSAKGFAKFEPLGYLFALGTIVELYLNGTSRIFLFLLIYFIVLLVFAALINKPNKLEEISYRCVTTLYVPLFLGSFLLLREFPFQSGYDTGGKIAVTIFGSIWVLDTFAYFAGKLFGRHKLFPRVSPKKTVEGGIGGFIGAMAVFYISSEYYCTELPVIHALVLGVIIGITGQLGDIVASFFKRQMNTKESSAILPGHGGFLDRFDSLIFVSPFAYFYFTLLLSSI